MYLVKSIVDGLKILGFDEETIKRSSKEKSLEEIFLSTLFLNYLIVLVIYMLIMMKGTLYFMGREVNTLVLFGFLMMYPFLYNLGVYFLYGFFGFMAEMVNNKTHIQPLLAVGFHSAIVYTVVLYLIALISIFNPSYALFLLIAFGLYFIYTMFICISTIYEFSFRQTLIVVMLPIVILSILLLVLFVSGIFDRLVIGILN